MNNPKEIKQILTPIMVAQHYLGQGKQKGNKIWYKSPFRNERTASFMVDNKSFHDFGESWDGDIISFIERYYNIDFLTAMRVLTRDFGLPENEKKSKEFEQYIKQKREQEQQMKRNLDNWFNSIFTKICKKLQIIKRQIELRQIDFKTAYDKECRLNILWELFFDAVNNDNKKIELWKSKEEIEKCLNANNVEK